MKFKIKKFKKNNEDKKNKLEIDIKKIFQENKKPIIVAGVALLVVSTFIVVIALCFSRTNEKKLEKKLENIGVAFYEDYYYDSLKDSIKDDARLKQLLAGFKDKGMEISLDNLSRIVIKYDDDKVRKFKDEMKDFVNSKTDKACDKDKTIVTIYPKEKYGKKDYTIKVHLECGFDKKEK